ncbi:MAG: hypothetical protein AAGA87_04295 [Pseudomonadota bacterium]
MKIVLHAHSSWSYDGKWTLPAIARLYGRLGVRAVMMTEHDTGFDRARFPDYRAECAAASTPKCTLIPGIEYSSPDNDIHILTWGLTEFLAEHRAVIDTLRDVQVAGGVAVFAHPIRREAWRQFDDAWVPYLSAIELWNRKSDGITSSPTALEIIRHTGLPATVGHDFHKLRHLYPLAMEAAGEISEPALVRAIADGTMRPLAFGKPLLGSDGTPRVARHDKAERLRQKLRDLVKR